MVNISENDIVYSFISNLIHLSDFPSWTEQRCLRCKNNTTK